MTAETITRKARAIIKARTTDQLIHDFILTGTMHDANIPTVRGWIMDELEVRDPDAFAAWMDKDDATDSDLFLFF